MNGYKYRLTFGFSHLTSNQPSSRSVEASSFVLSIKHEGLHPLRGVEVPYIAQKGFSHLEQGRPAFHESLLLWSQRADET